MGYDDAITMSKDIDSSSFVSYLDKTKNNWTVNINELYFQIIFPTMNATVVINLTCGLLDWVRITISMNLIACVRILNTNQPELLIVMNIF